ncbi:MAG: ROK family transcriptional regulator [Lentisphaeraceae bacterium]|nr:ROK family transcriptional regulator [Lentisphaeraceae bacterium]
MTSNISNHILKRAQNRLEIYKALQVHGPLTRSELADLCQIRKNSIGSLIDGLQEQGFLNNVSNRKRMPLELDKSSRTVLSIEFFVRHFNIAVINLKGKVLHRETLENIAETRADYLKTITDAALIFSQKHCKNLLGVGIALPGIVDNNGTCIAANNLPDFNNVPLKSLFEAYFSCPVSVMNCVDASLHSFDRLSNKSRKIKNALFFDIVSGVGTATMINNEIVGGSHHMGGEIGQIIPLGQKKNIDSLCSMDSILRDASSIAGRDIKDVFEFLSVLKDNKKIEQMLEQKAAIIVEPLIFGLGILDPDTIIFSNQPKEFYNLLISYFKKEIDKRMLLLKANFLISSENNSLTGAAIKLMDNVFADPDFDSVH